ncbi:MAG: PilZ domain-containing protein [Deltaproteobacteria bacterium]|nr:PilZ domain-containing protein [Deltaproteobacteria bacterium]
MDPRRTEPRFDRQVDVELTHAGTAYTGVTRDLSLSGLCARFDAAFPFGARVRLRFTVPGHPQPVEVDGEVRWSQPASEGGKFYGVHFLGLRARDVWALNRFFQASPAGGVPVPGRGGAAGGPQS